MHKATQTSGQNNQAVHDPVEGPAGHDSGIFGLNCTLEQARVVLVPVPFEATVSYGEGTADAPAAILAASHQVDLFDVELGRPYEAGIHMLPIPEDIAQLSSVAKQSARRGMGDDAQIVHAACAKMNDYVYSTCAHWLAQNKLVGTIGGDHSVALGAIRAHAETFGEIGVFHLDAHADLRVAYEGFEFSHASVMERVLATVPGVRKLVQFGLRDLSETEYRETQSSPRVCSFFDYELSQARLENRLLSRFAAMIEALPHHVYLSFDIDGLDPRFCPGTGTPVPGGLSFMELNTLLGLLARSGRKIIGFDLVEVAPSADDREWNANVGARLLYKMIGWALLSQN